jgi:hypothetical protein
MLTEIKDLDDIILFTKQLIVEGVNVHPDDDFSDYVNMETGEPTYSKEGADFRNSLMDQCFVVCKSTNNDIYNIMQDIYLAETGLDKFIPKSTDILEVE